MVPHSILKPGEPWAVSEALQGHTLPVEQPRHSGAPGGTRGQGRAARDSVEGEAFVKALPPAWIHQGQGTSVVLGSSRMANGILTPLWL